MEARMKPTLRYIHWFIGVALMLLGYVIPAVEPLTPMGVKIVMIFVGMIYLWCTVNPAGGSLLSLFMVGVVGYAPFKKILSDGFAEPNFLILFYSCILFMSAIESGMPKYITHGIFKSTKGIISGRPVVLVFILMMAAFIMSALTNVIPTILMFWSICYAVIAELELEKTDGYSKMLVLSTFLGAMLGNALFPFKNATIIILGAYEKASGMGIPYGPYALINLFGSIIIMVLFCMAIKYVFRIDMTKVQNIDGEMLSREQLPPMSISVKAHLWAVLVFIFLALIESMMPTAFFSNFLKSLGAEGIAAVTLILLLMIQDDGKPCLKLGKTMSTMPWGPVFMVMAAVYMAGALRNHEVTGIMPWLRQLLNPILGGHGEFVFAVIFVFLAVILTCLFHNGALGNMLMPILAVVASANNYNGLAIAAIATMTINIAYLAPSASNYAPLLHDNKEYLSLKDIWTYGLFFEILTFVVFVFIGLPIANIFM